MSLFMCDFKRLLHHYYLRPPTLLKVSFDKVINHLMLEQSSLNNSDPVDTFITVIFIKTI